MKTQYIFLLSLCLALALALGSCKKKKDPTPAERLRESAWRAAGLTINGAAQPSGSLRLIFTEAGFSGTLADGTPVIGTWRLANNDGTLVLTFTSNPPGEQQWTAFRFTDDGWEATFTTKNYKDQTVVFVYRFVAG